MSLILWTLLAITVLAILLSLVPFSAAIYTRKNYSQSIRLLELAALILIWPFPVLVYLSALFRMLCYKLPDPWNGIYRAFNDFRR